MWTGRRCGYGIDADFRWPLWRVSRAGWHSSIDRRSLSGNFERGEIVSPVGCIASKVGKPNLVMPDARHRRPLKFLLYHQSVKTQRTAPKSVLRSWIRVALPLRLGAFICHFVLRKRRNEVLEKVNGRPMEPVLKRSLQQES